MSKTKVVVMGAEGPQAVPGIESISPDAQCHYVQGGAALREALPGAEVLLGWDFRADEVEAAWPAATNLKWIQWSGAGVDSLLFAELANSDVTVTNAGGVFDRAMAEYTLGAILSHAKKFRETFRLQDDNHWLYRTNTRILGQKALVVGVGSIGREVARLLSAVGLDVTGVGRTARDGDPDFGHVHAVDALLDLLPSADYVVLITPLTEQTRDMFGTQELAAMKPSSYFINIGRGQLLDEGALVSAIDDGTIAGAMLDVFREEPLPAVSPLWQRESIFVSPHCCGDFDGFKDEVAALFLENFKRYRRGQALLSVVEKTLGFVPSHTG